MVQVLNIKMGNGQAVINYVTEDGLIMQQVCNEKEIMETIKSLKED